MRSITTTDLAELGDGVTLIDVREPDEFADVRIPFAVNVPMSTLGERADDISRDGDVYVICKLGGRSSNVVEALEARGWTNLVNVEGGTMQWVDEQRPTTAG